MVFATLYYKLVTKGLIGYDAKGALGVAAFIELMAELGMLGSLIGKLV